ncbi:MAG: hypothetical protein KAW12_22375 [Candidatus Aminicenantes bacterium]|nr:hypothetical protein [Candidatus Aminicenantes bacterium]
MIKKVCLFLVVLVAFAAFAGSTPINLSKSANRASVHVSVLAYGNNVMVTWREEYLWDIYYTIYSNGSWSTPRPTFDTGVISKNPHIAEGPDGVIHMTWGEGNASASREINHAIYRNGVWQNMTEIYYSGGKNSNWPRVGILDNNTVNITWTSELVNRDYQGIRNNWKVAGGSWASANRVDDKPNAHTTGHSDVYCRGNTSYCVWREGLLYWGYNIMFAQKYLNGTWSTPVRINDTAGTHSYPRLAVDSAGTVHVLWENFRNARYARRENGVWYPSTRINVVDGKHPNFLDIDVDPGNNVHACWVSNISDTRRDIYYNYKENGVAWNAADNVRLSTSYTPNQLPAISVSDTGAAHVVWSSYGEGVPGDVMYERVESHMSSIDVTAPVQGTVYTVGSTVRVAWTTEGITSGDVTIILKSSDGVNSFVIGSYAYNASPRDFVIPPEIPPGYYYIKIKQSGVFGKSGTFSVADITVTSDNDGSTYGIGSYMDLAWTATGITGSLSANLIRTDGPESYSLKTDLPYNASPYTFYIPPEVVPGSYFIRLKQAPVNGRSAVFNLIRSELSLTSPSGGETFYNGDNMEIAWTTTGISGDLKLTLQKSDGSSATLIGKPSAASSPNNYPIPCTLAAGTYYVKARHNTIVDTTADFTITPNPAESITVTRPNGGEEERAGTLQTVTWTSTGAIPNVKIEFSPDNGVNWGVLVPSTANTGSYTGLVPPESPSTTQGLMRISDAADGCPSDTSDRTFTVLPALPIHVYSPLGGESYSEGEQISVGWTTSGITGNVVILLIKADRTATYSVGTFPYNAGITLYTVPAGVPAGDYFIKIKLSPYYGKSNNFTIN